MNRATLFAILPVLFRQLVVKWTFSTFYEKKREDKWCTNISVLVHHPLLKTVNSKEKKFAPKVSKFFPLRKDSFSEGSKKNVDRAVSLEKVSITLEIIMLALLHNDATSNLGPVVQNLKLLANLTLKLLS